MLMKTKHRSLADLFESFADDHPPVVTDPDWMDGRDEDTSVQPSDARLEVLLAVAKDRSRLGIGVCDIAGQGTELVEAYSTVYYIMLSLEVQRMVYTTSPVHPRRSGVWRGYKATAFGKAVLKHYGIKLNERNSAHDNQRKAA